MKRKVQVYLCSRTKPEFHLVNEVIAETLEKNGIEVFVPHRLDIAHPEHKKDPFARDFAEMQRATHCIAVGPFGSDCSSEIGWFAGKGIPILAIFGSVEAVEKFRQDQPMVAGFVYQCLLLTELTTMLRAGGLK